MDLRPPLGCLSAHVYVCVCVCVCELLPSNPSISLCQQSNVQVQTLHPIDYTPTPTNSPCGGISVLGSMFTADLQRTSIEVLSTPSPQPAIRQPLDHQRKRERAEQNRGDQLWYRFPRAGVLVSISVIAIPAASSTVHRSVTKTLSKPLISTVR